MKTFRTFLIPEVSEQVSTPTGMGFRKLVLKVTLDHFGTPVIMVPIQEGPVEGAPDPGGESTQ
jgi:hypothetical protein